MDWNRVEGNWKQIKGKVKEQWGKLTDDDLDQINGKREQLEGKIQDMPRTRLGKTSTTGIQTSASIEPRCARALAFKGRRCGDLFDLGLGVDSAKSEQFVVRIAVAQNS